MTTKWLNRALIGLALWTLSATGVRALTFQVVGQGLFEIPLNYGCPTGSANCLTSLDFSLGSPATATGTISITGHLATIALQVASVTFIGPSLSTVTFAGENYAGTAPVTTYSIGCCNYFQTGLGSGSVSGTANLNPFSVLPSITDLYCSTFALGGGCIVTYGFTGGFANVEGHDWVHRFNLSVLHALPEPASALLVALGLAGLAHRSRRA